ncbi:MAG TPA: ABC transporter permease [Chitinophagaceae bacterium]|nr:ABC transporter permease [Chitinophagaceae bacterium]
MIIHYIKVAFRNLSAQKIPAFINIAGLSIGLACFSLFLLYAVNEFSFDSFHKNKNNIYRVYEWDQKAGQGDAGMYMPLGPALKKDFPEVEDYVRFYKEWKDKLARVGDNTALSVPVAYTDPQMFSVFSFKLLYGNAATALAGTQNIVLTKDKAIQLFGEANVVGKTVEIKVGDTFQPFVVGAVAENIPANSSIRFNVLLSWDYLQNSPQGKDAVNNWRYSGFQTFVKLREGSSLAGAALAKFSQKYMPWEAEEFKQSGWNGTGPLPISFRLQPLQDIHSNLKISAGADHAVDPKTTWILLGIATGVLLIACINFTTLAIGRSSKRAKEVGVRKAIGGAKEQLVWQFFTESLMLSIISALLGLLLAKLLLPYFNKLAEKDLQFSFSQYPALIWLFAGLALLTGILAGIYPAVILSSFRPVEVLKSKIKVGGANFFSRSLVTLQFVLSMCLIISTTVMLQQVKYMRTKDPGFNRENVVVINADETDAAKTFPLFKQAITKFPQVEGIASSGAGFGEGYNSTGFEYNGKHQQVFRCFASADFTKVLGMHIVAGRMLNDNMASDSVTGVLVNEALVKSMGLTDDKALGVRLEGLSKVTPVVVGVVKDFNFLPLSQQIQPIVFVNGSPFGMSKFFVRVKPGYPAAAIAAMQKTWNSLVPSIPFQYSFLDENLDSLYTSDERWGNIAGWAGGVSIFLACLGLFGLASLAAINRTKEIGIRKVMGASTAVIVKILSAEFLQLVVVAIVIATPVTWYFMYEWLQGYAYRISISAWIFIVTGVAGLLIALLTVSFQAVKAALANPVKSLRTE